MTTPPIPAPAKPLSGPQMALRKLGLLRDIDLALHLPPRYEDETASSNCATPALAK